MSELIKYVWMRKGSSYDISLLRNMQPYYPSQPISPIGYNLYKLVLVKRLPKK